MRGQGWRRSGRRRNDFTLALPIPRALMLCQSLLRPMLVQLGTLSMLLEVLSLLFAPPPPPRRARARPRAERTRARTVQLTVTIFATVTIPIAIAIHSVTVVGVWVDVVLVRPRARARLGATPASLGLLALDLVSFVGLGELSLFRI